ncbi:hypothetical protein M8J75_001878 [Diaphorina citri]|nr:hypothetical protein M8J75_001878 [Diaphorina citri]
MSKRKFAKNLSTDGLNQIESDPNFLKRVITLLPIPKNQICPERIIKHVGANVYQCQNVEKKKDVRKVDISDIQIHSKPPV